ncbi:DNA-binding protein [Streptomyces sp. NPDC002088]|uniref:DNA-binding protein n=1 Tax=Streptomyces sp. NPDC002088 TaxID=3154665 RepID=UPI0033275F2F
MTHHPVLLRTAPLQGETTSSLICRIASRYGMEAKVLRSCWQWRNYPPGHDGGGARADAEVLLNAAGRQLLAGLCGVEEDVLARALPSWGQEDSKLSAGKDGVPAAAWRTGGAVAGPVAFGCRLCAARRTGTAVRVVRYAPRWERVCLRHGRWLLDADADQPLEYLDVRGVPEVAAAQRRWAGVARRAARIGVEPERVFALAYAVVAQWWEQALHWEREAVWPRRLHQVAGGNTGRELERWRIVGRNAVVFPEVVAVADALLDPDMAELAWHASGGMRPRVQGGDDPFCHRLGERVDRDWLGSLVAADYGGPLSGWRSAIVRARHGGGPPGWRDDPWHLKREQQPATMAGQLRVMVAEAQAGGSGTRWRATVSAERRFHITPLLDEAREDLAQLRGVHSGTTAEVARELLEHLSHSAELIDRAVLHAAAAAVAAGVALQDVAQWSRLPAEELAEVLAAGQVDGWRPEGRCRGL